MDEMETLSAEIANLRKELEGLRRDVRGLSRSLSDLNDTGSEGLIGAIIALTDALNKHREA